ncbi:YkgJ family cysteine cluster protein [bacterium]|nr:YkgJ family cysteine cluster protein [bacterium]
MFSQIKFFIQKLQSSKYIKKGRCKMCGACCRNILLFSDKNLPVMTEEQFEKIKEWDKHFRSFYISGKSETGALLFTCYALGDNNKCKLYLFRGLGCRQYPHKNTKFLINGGKMLEGCGFYFEPDKKFEEYLK